jgi:hypothetical protein
MNLDDIIINTSLKDNKVDQTIFEGKTKKKVKKKITKKKSSNK